MRVQLLQLSCDVCPTVVTPPPALDGQAPPGWAVVTLRMAGRLVECHVCPTCMGNLIDPPDCTPAQLHRLSLERRLGGVA